MVDPCPDSMAFTARIRFGAIKTQNNIVMHAKISCWYFSATRSMNIDRENWCMDAVDGAYSNVGGYLSFRITTPSSWGNSVLGKINFYCIEKRNHHNIVAKSFWGGKKRATRHAKPNGIYAPCVCVLSLDGRRVAPTLRYSTDRLFTMTTTTNSRHAFSQWFDGQLRAAHSSESR